jgi:hypothetical protein
VSAAVFTGTRRTLRPVAVATLVATAAGAGIGVVIASGGSDAPPAAAPVPRIGLASGVARLPLPAGWKPLGRPSSLRGLEAATAVRGVLADEVALDIRAPQSASLLPAGVAAAAGPLPAPRLRRLAAGPVWRYDLPGPAQGTRIVALALASTGGVVTMTCEAGAEAIVAAGGECERAMGSVKLDGAATLPPAPETAARIVLPATVARLNRERRGGRRALAATRSQRGRSAAALGLARGYAAAAGRLRPLAAGGAVRLTATLAALAREHRALAIASARRNAPVARRVNVRIAGDERRLAALLAAISAQG